MDNRAKKCLQPSGFLFLCLAIVLAACSAPKIPTTLSPPEAGWKRVVWHVSSGYLFWYPDNRYTFDVPEDCHISVNEGVESAISGSDGWQAPLIGLRYDGDKAQREECAAKFKNNPALKRQYWTDARQELLEVLKTPFARNPYGNTLSSTEISSQKTGGGIPFWRADLQYRDRGLARRTCIMVNDDGVQLTFDSTPCTEKIVASMRRQ